MSKNHEQFPQQKFTCVEFERRKICKTSDTLFAIKTKSLTMKYITYRIYSKYRKLSMETPCLTTETWRLTLNDFLIT